MNTLLWVLQAVLAVTFVAHGTLFLFPPAALRMIAKQMSFPLGFRRFVYVAEILAGFGLTLPGLSGLLPWLTPLAAAWCPSWPARWSYTCHAGRWRRRSSPLSSSLSQPSWPTRAG